MAKINPRDISRDTECYAAIEMDFGFRCGRLKGWKLYDFLNPDLYMTLNQSPSEIIAAFETCEELEQWRAEVQGAPKSEQNKSGQASLDDLQNEQPNEVKLKAVGSCKDRLIISQIL